MKPSKPMFVFIEGQEFVLKRRRPPYTGEFHLWKRLPATILYTEQEDDVEMVVVSIDAMGAKIVKPPV